MGRDLVLTSTGVWRNICEPIEGLLLRTGSICHLWGRRSQCANASLSRRPSSPAAGLEHVPSRRTSRKPARARKAPGRFSWRSRLALDGAVVSDLEAGRVTEPVLVVSKRGTTTARAARRATPAPVQALVPETHVHTMSTTITPEPVLRAGARTSGSGVRSGTRGGDGSGQAAPENTTLPGMLPGITNRGTGIIIRGGLGRIDDDCDEHNIRGAAPAAPRSTD